MSFRSLAAPIIRGHGEARPRAENCGKRDWLEFSPPAALPPCRWVGRLDLIKRRQRASGSVRLRTQSETPLVDDMGGFPFFFGRSHSVEGVQRSRGAPYGI